MHFFLSERAMFDAFRDDKHFAGSESHGAVAHLDVEGAFEDQKEVVGFIMLVPDEFAFNFDKHHVGVVQLRNGARRPIICEGGQFLGKIDFVFRKR